MESFKRFQSRLLDGFKKECDFFNNAIFVELEHLRERVRGIERLEAENANLQSQLRKCSNPACELCIKTDEQPLAGNTILEDYASRASEKDAISVSPEKNLKKNEDLQQRLDSQTLEYAKLRQAHEVVLRKLREHQLVIKSLQESGFENPACGTSGRSINGSESICGSVKAPENAQNQAGIALSLWTEEMSPIRQDMSTERQIQDQVAEEKINLHSPHGFQQDILLQDQEVSKKKTEENPAERKFPTSGNRSYSLDYLSSSPEILFERPAKRRRVPKFSKPDTPLCSDSRYDIHVTGSQVKIEDQSSEQTVLVLDQNINRAQESIDLDATRTPIALSQRCRGSGVPGLGIHVDSDEPSQHKQTLEVTNFTNQEGLTSCPKNQSYEPIRPCTRITSESDSRSEERTNSLRVWQKGNLVADTDLENNNQSIQAIELLEEEVVPKTLHRMQTESHGSFNVLESEQASSQPVPIGTSSKSVRRNGPRPILQPKQANAMILPNESVRTGSANGDQQDCFKRGCDTDRATSSIKRFRSPHTDSTGRKEIATPWYPTRIIRDVKSRLEKPQHDTSSKQVRLLQPQRPLRNMAPQQLCLHNFKLNPIVNQGLDFTYNESVRRKDERQCLPNCAKEVCCGARFSKMLLIGGEAPLFGIEGPLSRTETNDLHFGLVHASDSTETALSQQAKMREFASKYGKHRNAHGRPKSPPGFWRTEMPSTQELNIDNRRAQELEQQKVESRRLEAIRPRGQWLFRDESST